MHQPPPSAARISTEHALLGKISFNLAIDELKVAVMPITAPPPSALVSYIPPHRIDGLPSSFPAGFFVTGIYHTNLNVHQDALIVSESE